ncbi:response regulator [Georgenia sp. Z1491]|uniref:response regulator n=1 Tax=Georgenia sp. Z1491 TaxID=3416707 RepID=UPI003CF5F5A3
MTEMDAGTDGGVITVLLADDQALLRMGFRMVLDAEDDIEVVGEAGDGRTAVAQAAALHPDVILMDVRMPELNGIDATARIVRSYPQARILILTTFDFDEYAFAGLRAGASGFLLKDTPPGDLVEAIRRVAGGDAVITPRITRRMLEMFGPRLPATGRERTPAERDPRIASLTSRELEVFTLLAQGLSNAEIAGELVVSETTVKTHVGAVLGKLALRDRVQAVVLAYETGIVQPA